MNIVSLFDGISCGRVALDRAGISVNSYTAFEIDKYAKSISRYNYPDIEQHGDVLNADFNRYIGHDIVMGGSPCTFWSISKTNREVDKSGIGWKLFMKFVEAVRVISPRFFLYENVASMPQSIKKYITEELGCEPIMINSALVSAQSRKRLYWTNIQGVIQPEDNGILLKDILEQEFCTRLSNTHKQKALSMANRQETGLFAAKTTKESEAVREDENKSLNRLKIRNDDKSDATTMVLSDSVIRSPVRVGEIGKGGQGNRVYSVYGKTVSLMANGGGRGAKTGLYKIDLPEGGYIIRKLTPVEAERCQTLPDNYTAFGIDENNKTVNISDSQRYKSVGNGWTVDVIANILSHI